MRRRLAMLTALALSAGTLMSACTGSEGSEQASSARTEEATADTETTGTQESQAVSDTAESDETGADATELPVETAEFDLMIQIESTGTFFDSYDEIPVVQYLNNQVWYPREGEAGVQVTLDIIQPPTGEEVNFINNLIATGEYPDVFAFGRSGSSAKQLYEEEMILDLTPYVEEYMPNYLQWIENHPEYRQDMTYDIDGEEKYLQLYLTTDVAGDHWGGYCYRRDWILKYGTDEDGNAFEGGYDEDGVWSDNIVFPGGSTYPEYISDWEWMLDIFATAIAEEGIEDGYAVQMYYPGYIQTGEIVSGFGGDIFFYTVDDDGSIIYGADSDDARAYIECMTHWYEEGWLDPVFEERTSDIFFMIDNAGVYSGKVGCWYGMNSQLLNGLMSEEEGALSDICVFAAPQPINDTYGGSDQKNHLPTSYLQAGGLLSDGFVISEKAEGKDIAALCTMFDYLYSYEGGLLRSYGFSEEMMEEIQDEFYLAHGLTRGTYRLDTSADGEPVPVLFEERNAEEDLSTVASAFRLPGIQINKNLTDEDEDPLYREQIDLWGMYDETATGELPTRATANLTTEQTEEGGLINNALSTYLAQEVASFITGRRDIADDADWQDYCDSVRALGPDTYIEYLNESLGK